MSWTYSGDPSSSLLDQVRFLIGDTDTNIQQISNEEINWALDEADNNVYEAAVLCLESIIAKYARYQKSKTVGDLSITYGDLVKNLQSILTSVRKRSALALAPPFAGGIRESQKEDNESDTDLVVPAFRVDMHENNKD